MKILGATLILLILATWPVRLPASDGPASLSHNPFSRPSSEVIPVAREVRVDNDNTPESLPLLATMVGRVNRLANVDGRILKPGDDYQGYRLVKILEDSVVFERRGETITVFVKSPDAEDRAERRPLNPERKR